MTKPTKLRKLKTVAFSGPAENVFRGMATLAFGNIVARVIGVASLPFLTRLYSPEEFGVLAVFTALTGILVPFITLRYVLALPLPRRDGMAINLLVLSAALMLGISIIISLVLWIGGSQLLGLLSMEVLAPYWWLLSLGLIGGGGYELLSLWATRKRAYKHIAKTTATQSLLGSLTKLIMGFLAIKPLGLMVGQVVSNSGGIVSLLVRFGSDFNRNRRFINVKRIKLVAGRYRNFPIYRLPSQFLLTFSIQSPVLFFSTIYGAEDTGQLSMALTVIALPLSILGTSVSKAYYAETAKVGIRSPDKLILITRAVTKRLFLLSIMPFLVFLLGSEYLFGVAFGEQWVVGGEYAKALSLYLVAQFITAPVMNIFNVIDKQRLFLFFNILRVIIVLLLFGLVVPFFSVDSMRSVVVYSVLMAIFYFSIYFFVMIQLNRICENGWSGE